MTVTNTRARRALAGAGALALGLLSIGVTASSAYAAVGPDQPGAPSQGTLTINKYGGLPVDQGGDLSEPLDGVEFTVTQVGRSEGVSCVPLDVTKAAQWDGLEGLFGSAPAKPADPFCLTGTTETETTADGSASFTLPLGVYYVEETDRGENPVVSPVPSFYVSIPTSNGAGGEGWNYNVVADPKNQLMDAPSKTIADRPSALTVGSEVTWTINVPIPTLAAGDTFNSASVTDQLDSRLEYVSSEAKVGSDTLFPEIDADGVTWKFDPVVLDAHQGKSLTITLVTTVTEVGDGQIVNPGGDVGAGGYYSEFNGTTVPGLTSPETYWGQLSIQKNDDSTPAQPLAGAEFQVFEPEADGSCAAAAPATGAVATGTSDEDGVVRWSGVTPTSALGLWIANVNDGPANPTPTKDYCVYETVIPAGHTATLIDNPVKIEAGVASLTELTVVNPKKVGPNLPLTGAQGTLIMSIGGLALLAIGVTGIVLARRRANANVNG